MVSGLVVSGLVVSDSVVDCVTFLLDLTLLNFRF
jgi:hypothetical protein